VSDGAIVEALFKDGLEWQLKKSD